MKKMPGNSQLDTQQGKGKSESPENRQLRKRLEELEQEKTLRENELVRRDKLIEKLTLQNQGLRRVLKLLPNLEDIKHYSKAYVSKVRLPPQLVTNLTRHGPRRLIVNQDQANALVLELCRFLVLKSICEDFDGTKLMASPAIDAAWYGRLCYYRIINVSFCLRYLFFPSLDIYCRREFMQLPDLYSQFCDELCGKILNRQENPVGNEENQTSSSSSSSSSSSRPSSSSPPSLLHTLILYGLIFDERAPPSLWPFEEEGTNKTPSTKENNKKRTFEGGSSKTEGDREGKKNRALRELKN